MRKFLGRTRAAVQGFWARLSEGMALQALWTQFSMETREGFRFYLKESRTHGTENVGGWRQSLSPKKAQAVFWALAGKLTPARRVFLLTALLGGFVLRRPWIAIIGLLLVLALELADRVLMKRDLEIARQIQHWLVPGTPPVAPGVELAFATRAANTVSGDYFDALVREPEGDGPPAPRLLLAVADVAGKGVPAALLMATFQASLRTLAAIPADLDDIIAGLNRYACAHSLDGQRFTTAFIGELETRTRLLRYVCAGHQPPILRRASGSLERLSAGSLPFGIDPDRIYPRGSVTLHSGDLLVIFTDGVPDAVNEHGEEYEEGRLLRQVAAMTDLPPADALNRLRSDVERFVGVARQRDDMTWLVMRVT